MQRFNTKLGMGTHSTKKICLSIYGGTLLLFSLIIMGCKKSQVPDESSARFRFYLTTADSCFREYNFEQAKTYLDSASFRVEKVNDSIFLGYYYQLLGTYYTYKRNDSEAHANYYTAIDYYEKAGEISQLSPIYYNLAISYIQQNDTGKLRQIVGKMQDISFKQKNEILLMNLYEIKAYYYSSLYEKRNQPVNLLDSIICYEHKAISIFENNPSIQSQKPNIAYNYVRLADNWIGKQAYNPDSVSYYLRKGEQYANPLDTALTINSLNVKGEMAYSENRYKEAENIFKQQIGLMDQWSGKGNLSMYVVLCDRLSKISEIKGDYASALKYERKKIDSLNTIHDAERRKIIDELEFKYETKQKDMEIKQLQKINRFRTYIGYLYIGLLILSLVSFFFIVRWLRMRKKAADSQLQLIEKEKSEIESQAKLQESQLQLHKSQLRLREKQAQLKEEKLKKVELEKYEALLENHFKEEEIKERDKDLIALKKEQEDLNTQIQDFTERLHQYEQNQQRRKQPDTYFHSIVDELNTSIVTKLGASEKQKEYIATLQRMDAVFFLKEVYANGDDLSIMNLKYCLAFAIGMNTQDIADCFNVWPQSVHMARYRLRSKFQMDKAIDFDLFLRQWLR